MVNDMSEENTLTEAAQAAASKYKTLGRAVMANDVPASEEILKIFQDSGKTLGETEILHLGLKWLGGKNGRPIEMAEFLQKLGFDYEQHFATKDENVGMRLPFRMLDEQEDQDLLIELINRKWVDRDLMDGNGDTLLTNALQKNQFEFADKLLALGMDINSSNVAGQTPLHVFAARLNFGAVDWLCRNGADPLVEDLQNARPSEMVPEKMDGWDVESMYNVLEDYAESFAKGGSFVSSAEFDQMVTKEKGPEGEGQDDDGQTYGEQADQAKKILGGFGL